MPLICSTCSIDNLTGLYTLIEIELFFIRIYFRTESGPNRIKVIDIQRYSNFFRKNNELKLQNQNYCNYYSISECHTSKIYGSNLLKSTFFYYLRFVRFLQL